MNNRLGTFQQLNSAFIFAKYITVNIKADIRALKYSMFILRFLLKVTEIWSKHRITNFQNFRFFGFTFVVHVQKILL